MEAVCVSDDDDGYDSGDTYACMPCLCCYYWEAILHSPTTLFPLSVFPSRCVDDMTPTDPSDLCCLTRVPSI